jgi:predicted N-acetyltransferase YhbS
MTFLCNDAERHDHLFRSTPFIAIGDESEADFAAREDLLDAAFGPARFEKTSERLREGRRAARGLALAAKDGDELVGTVRLWHIVAGEIPALLLGPLAVAETHRCLGLGRRLMAEALFRALMQGHKAVLLVGDAPYYAPFGFERRHTEKLVLPGPVDRNRFLGLELAPDTLRGAEGAVIATSALDLSVHRTREDQQGVYRRAA